MAPLKSTYHSKLFREFQGIDALAFHQLIRFFEEKEDAIQRLDFEEYFELLVSYVDALFETGAYQKHLTVVDLVIESSVIKNIHHFKGEDIFSKMLYRKAASLFQLHKFCEADYILRELLRMNPSDSDSIIFLKKCLRHRKVDFIQTIRAITIFMLLLSAVVISFEVLLIHPFYHKFTTLFHAIRILLLTIAGIVFFGGNLIHRLRVEREVKAFVEDIQKSKK